MWMILGGPNPKDGDSVLCAGVVIDVDDQKY